MPEGDLTKTRASLVCEKALCGFATQIGVGNHLLLSNGEKNTGGDTRPSILADAFEAIIAAIYMDGGMEQARSLFCVLLNLPFKRQSQNHLKIIKQCSRKLFSKTLRST